MAATFLSKRELMLRKFVFRMFYEGHTWKLNSLKNDFQGIYIFHFLISFFDVFVYFI